MTKDLKILTSLTHALHKFSDVEEIYRVALDSVMELENIDMTAIYLVDKEKHEAVLQAHRNLPEDYLRRANGIPYPKGVTWKLINSGSIFNIEDVQKDLDIGPAGRDIGPHGSLGIPIFLEEKVIGVIWFASYKERKFNEEEVTLLSTLGDQIAIAIAKAKREETLRASLAQLSKKSRYETIISTVTRSVHRSINLDEVLENAVDAMSKNIDGAENVVIYLVEGEEAVMRANRGYPDWYIQQVKRIPYPKGATWKTIIEDKPRYVTDVDQENVIGPAGRKVGTKSYLSMPIHFEGKTIGCMNIHSIKKNAFDEEELKLLEIVAQQIEIAINNAQQAELLYRANEELELRVRERTQRLSEINEELKKEIVWRKQAENALRNSEGQYRILYENNPSMYFTIDKRGRILSLNQFGAEQLGYVAEELIGQSVLDVFHEDDREGVLEHLSACLRNPTKVAHWEFRKVRRDGSILWVRESARAVRRSDGDIVVLIVCEDITDRRRAEERLKGSLREKEMLLKEVHHRVKNNLQVISSLLDLQADYLKDKQAIEMMSKSRNRVRSMALVHERLYQSKNMTKIDFAEYIRDLTDNISYSYGVNSSKVKLKIEAEGVLLNINSAIPLGLIINELVSNSLKYAFPKREKGEICISLRSDNGGSDLPSRPEFTLIVGNNGVGFPRNLNFRETKSLGLQLVIALVDQIGGAIELDRTNGVRFKITFTEPKPKEEINTLIE